MRLKHLCVLLLIAAPLAADAAVVFTTRTQNRNTFVDGSSRTRRVNFGGGSVSDQVLEAVIVVDFMKADGEAYGVNNGGTPYYDEIDLRLISPNGTSVALISPNDFNNGFGTGGFGFGNVLFFGGTGFPVVNVNPNTPQVGNFIATGNMKDFEIEDPAGRWRLYMGDTVAQDGLSVNRFTVGLWTGDPLSDVSGTTSFGNVLVGSSVDQTLSVANIGDTHNLFSDGTTVSTELSGTISTPTGDPTFTAVGGVSNYNGITVAGATADRIFRYAPTVRNAGETADVDFVSDGGNSTETLTGRGVAPLVALDTSNTDAGLVRIGDSGNASFTITNNGDGNLSGLGAISNLNGTLSAATGEFSGGGTAFSLTDGSASTPVFAYAPVDRGSDSQSVTLSLSNGSADGTNSASSQGITLDGRGVGPEFMSIGDTGGVIDFGIVSVGQTFTMPLTLMNDTPDGDLGSLTDLSMFGYTITGMDPSEFNLTGFAPTILADGTSIGVLVEFMALVQGAFNADLTFSTDQDAAFGVAGTSFVFSLIGVAVVPEPSTFVLFVLGLLLFTTCSRSFGARRRSKRR